MAMNRSMPLRAVLLSAATLTFALPAAVSANEPARPAAPIVVAGAPAGEVVAAAPAATDALLEIDAAGARSVQSRSQAPLTTAPTKPASNQWLVVLIQTALAEKGCNRLSINGEWDNQTRLSLASVLGTDKTASDLEPTNATLSALRTAAVERCGLTGATEAEASVTAPAALTRKSATKERKEKKSRTVAVATEPAPRAKSAAVRTPAKVQQRAPSAPVVARAPATFARPIGVGAF